MIARPALRLLRHGSLWLYRAATLVLVVAALLIGGGVLLLRYWLLPGVDQYRPQIEAALSRAAEQRITLSAVTGEWEGFRPRLSLHDMRVYDRRGVERLALAKVEGTLSWTTFLARDVRFHAIELTGLSIDIRRDASGTLLIAGMPAHAESGAESGGFGSWLLAQRSITVRDSTLTWIDETLGGAALRLEGVQLQLERRFGVQRFGVQASPPLEVGSLVDLRGELRTGGPGLTGRVYLQVGYVDLAALRQWIDLPLKISRGAGAVDVWARLDAGRMQAVSADVALSDVSLRLRADLPELDLSQMSGRLGWTGDARATQVSAQNLSFTTPDGLRLPPASIRYRRAGAADDPTARSDLRFDALELAAVMRIVDRLPLDHVLRDRVAEMRPRGTLRDVEVSWIGPWDTRTEYGASGVFDRLAVAPSGYLPGFSSISGRAQADQRGGTMSLRAEADSQLDMPHVFIGPLPLEAMTAKLAWSMQPAGPLVRVEQLAFANAHAAGKVSGTYQAQTGKPGSIDLTGSFERGDGRQGWRYLPLIVDHRVRDWLEHAIVSADVRDAHLRLRGDLTRFPFRDGTSGVFEVAMHFDNGTLAYGGGWPALENLRGEIVFRGAGMTLVASEARMFGAQLIRGTANIPDLNGRDPVLQVRAETEGSTEDFLRFIAESPVDHMIDGFTRQMRASGRGGLSVSLDLPLDKISQGRVSGHYRFAGNTLNPGYGAPLVEQFAGQLVFAEDSVSLREASGRVLGMPTRFTVDRAEAGGVLIRGAGRADAQALRGLLANPGLTISGSTDWHGTLSILGGGYELNLESDLRGLESALPVPLAKAAGERLAFKLQRRSVDDQRELVALSMGTRLSAQLLRSRTASGQVLRGEVRLNEPAPSPQRSGVWLGGKLAVLDFERWRPLLESGGGDQAGLSGLELQAGVLRAYGRDMHDVALQAVRSGPQWQGSVVAREAAGTLFWTPAGPGALTGRFSRLHIPAAAQQIEPAGQAAEGGPFPALDIVADDFQLGERPLGRLTLLATPENRDWRIRGLELRSSDGTANVTGVWQSGAAVPTTSIEVKIEAADIGNYLGRLKLPQGVKGGTGRLQGKLSWSGPPQDLDLATLAGAVELDARQGQFVKVEPGIGKLIGVLSLQSLPRRAALDFRDVFSEGFAFERLSATAAISRGVARTSDFTMLGNAARVGMKGEINLVSETQRLEVRVVPSMSESVALGAAIVNPAVGLATLLAQKALKDPIGHMVAFEYEVAGTWADPVVRKKKHEQPQEGRQGRQ